MPDLSSRYRIEDGTSCIDVAVTSIERLFDNRDPAPFSERDLDPRLDEYLVNCAEDLASHDKLRVIFWLEQMHQPGKIEEAYRAYFSDSLERLARRNRQRRRLGLKVTGIALVLLVGLFSLSELLRASITGHLGGALAEGILILSWIVMWRPIEVLIYDWVPPLRERKILRSLLSADLHVRQGAPPQ